ncbi:MAG: hypothetical protein RLY16_402 [Bacteroidota bacterium]|jgi:glutamine cyclotransferase
MTKHLAFFLLVGIFSCTDSPKPTPIDENITPSAPSGIAAPANITWNVLATYPHDKGAYTQGLEWHNGKLYESTGDYTNSSLRITDCKTGKVEQTHVMGSKEIFGEGITIFKNKIYQLTWQNNVVYEYDVQNIQQPVKTHTWSLEGWGISHYKDELVISDGSANLYFVNPTNFKINSTRQVVDNIGPVTSLNELEVIGDYVYANVYLQDYIVKIDLSNGHVVGKISLSGLIKQYAPAYTAAEGEVLNGIAYDSTTKKVFFTGKHWPLMFEANLPQ